MMIRVASHFVSVYRPVNLLIVRPGGYAREFASGQGLTPGLIPDVRRGRLVQGVGLLLVPPGIADICRTNEGIRHHFLFKGEVPVVHPGIRKMGTQVRAIKPAGDGPRIVDVDHVIACIPTSDVSGNGAQAVIGEPVGRQRCTAYAVLEAAAYQLRRNLAAVEPRRNGLSVIRKPVARTNYKRP